MSQRPVARRQQLIARLFQDDGAADLLPDLDRRRRRQHQFLVPSGPQPFRRRMAGERGGDTLAGDPIGGGGHQGP